MLNKTKTKTNKNQDAFKSNTNKLHKKIYINKNIKGNNPSLEETSKCIKKKLTLFVIKLVQS